MTRPWEEHWRVRNSVAETRILALALAAIDDVDARVVLADAIEESGWRSQYRDAAGGAEWMVHYDPPDLQVPAFYVAELLTMGWHNPDDPANEAEAWHVVEACRQWRRGRHQLRC